MRLQRSLANDVSSMTYLLVKPIILPTPDAAMVIFILTMAAPEDSKKLYMK